MQTFNLSASQLTMRIVNFREIRYLSPCFSILRRIKYDDNTEDKGRGWLVILIERTENGTWECSMIHLMNMEMGNLPEKYNVNRNRF